MSFSFLYSCITLKVLICKNSCNNFNYANWNLKIFFYGIKFKINKNSTFNQQNINEHDGACNVYLHELQMPCFLLEIYVYKIANIDEWNK